MKPVEEQLTLIRRGVDQIETEAELRHKLERSFKTGKPLRVKYGIDPTGIDVHLGHTVPLRKLRLFQELGHQAVLIIGNYTALVGDPSGRDQSRVRLTQEQVEANAVDYLKQISKIIDVNRAEVRKNGEWFSQFSFLRVMALTSTITVQRMLERDDFSKRYKEGKPISLHECLYPLMQGHDSVEIHADVELGGSEQLFNLMVGRDLQRDAGQEPQVCMTLPILRGLDGVRRMGKSLGNYVGVGEPAFEMFAKIMRIPDELLTEWFTLLTDRPKDEIARLTDAAQNPPMDAKKLLGTDVVGFYYGPAGGEQARKEWESRVSDRCDPAEIPEVAIAATEVADGKIWICKLLSLLRFTESNGAGRRLVEGGAVNLGPDREKVSDPKANVPVADGLIVRAGKQKIARVRIPMFVYKVSYDLSNAPPHECVALRDFMTHMDSWHDKHSVWYVASGDSREDLYNLLLSHVSLHDRLTVVLVTEVTTDYGAEGYVWLRDHGVQATAKPAKNNPTTTD